MSETRRPSTLARLDHLPPMNPRKLLASALAAACLGVLIALTFGATAWTASFPNIDVTGKAVAGAYDYQAPYAITPLSAGTALDWSLTNKTATCTLTGAVTFAYSNLSGTDVQTFNLYIVNAQATNCAFTFPTGTRIMGIAGYQTAGKGGRMTFEYWPGVSTNVFYSESL